MVQMNYLIPFYYHCQHLRLLPVVRAKGYDIISIIKSGNVSGQVMEFLENNKHHMIKITVEIDN